MAVLAASTLEPNATPHRSSSVKQMSIAGQVLGFALRSQQAVRSLTQSLFLRLYFAASFAICYTLFVTQIFAFRSYSTSRFLAAKSTLACKSTLLASWNSTRIKRLRKRLEFEFFVLILGPGGNSLFLLLFWPGWLLIAPAAWGLVMWAR